MDLTGLKDKAAGLLAAAGVTGRFDLHPLPGGSNNRVFLVQSAGWRALLKVYFQHPDDPRDRLGAEFTFLRFASEHRIHQVPRPLASDSAKGLGLYEYIEGEALHPGQVNNNAVEQALTFWRTLNRHRRSPAARLLPHASEACFSLADHVRCVDARVHRLRRVKAGSMIDEEAVAFIDTDLAKAWHEVKDAFEVQADRFLLSFEKKIDIRTWRLSPSDFGFHNALRTADGGLCFLDFEYAGWDDPARMICDFFCQPAVPVPMHYLDRFMAGVSDELAAFDTTRCRVELLFPVYRIKWCCILLNDFLDADTSRRQFANGSDDVEGRKRRQLTKARALLATQEAGYRAGHDVMAF
jgi:hypothetical protein